MHYVGDGFWVTKKGEKIALVDMEDSHLKNSLEVIGKMIDPAQQRLLRLFDSRNALQVEIKRRKDSGYQPKVKKPVVSKPALSEEGRKFRLDA